MQDNEEDPSKRARARLSRLAEAQDVRVGRALAEEEKAGGPLDGRTSQEIRRSHRMNMDEIAVLTKTTPQGTGATGRKSSGIIAQMLASLLPKSKRPKSSPSSAAQQPVEGRSNP
jgi:hypothetical protein